MYVGELYALHKTVFWMLGDELLNCREFESYIPAFIDKKLDFKTMEEFREHYESCEACREELSIQFLVSVGIQHLDNDDDNFDLYSELKKRLVSNDKQIERHKIYRQSQRYILTIGCVLLGLLLIWYLG